MSTTTTAAMSSLELNMGDDARAAALDDYRIVCVSREASLLGRKEVLGGKAKFGIFGDGKEVAQIALARQFRKGDFRSGYYRDQTLMMALGLLDVRGFFAQLYADADQQREPMTGGRQMNCHFSTHSLNEQGQFKRLTDQFNSSADISPTAGQMPRLLGLAQASKHYRALEKQMSEQGFDVSQFSRGGEEIAFGTIGDASTSEGMFWETINAAAVMQVPLLMSVWDDGYGISVPKELQTARASISQALSGMDASDGGRGIVIFKAKAWDYPELLATYERAAALCRAEHVPVLVHVEECTQPQGHSTSGSHERYKSKERLAWAAEYDGIAQLAKFLVMEGGVSQDELDAISTAAAKFVRAEQKAAWAAYSDAVAAELSTVKELLQPFEGAAQKLPVGSTRREMHEVVRQILHATRATDSAERRAISGWLSVQSKRMKNVYSADLYNEGEGSALKVEAVAPDVEGAELVDGRVVLRDNFKALFEQHPELLTFGEDTGKIGGVNQTMEGMQDTFGEERVADTGIRECTILGQGIGLAMRGLRPIAEIQYLDYIFYALQIMRDDLATVRYRSRGTQKAPVIVRSRGHRLEGIWHAGSPMGSIIHSVRGMHVCVPRNMVQAAGMYNTLLQSDEPALVVECLNGYRTKELLPKNLGAFRTPIGLAEVVREGADLTVVSYGSTFNLCVEAASRLSDLGVELELIDVRTLLPFDTTGVIAQSVAKTSRVIFIDEDVPGGATAFMLERAMQQGLWSMLDSEPRTLCAAPHLPPFGSDGDYFSKPSIEDIVERCYAMVSEARPDQLPSLL